ncbi:MAG TPA: carboxypeptidase-like regulatory domain-containing protein [Candidatus Acidoferrales bacterium]|nr:carboxypeptidase-like regulatory domain-containing protein [Candidatus Acidoferrales bacterium]
MSGIVTDGQTRRPIGGADVTIAGDQATSNAVTDSAGAFILPLAEGITEGTAVRIRVAKHGYEILDSWKPVSSTIPLQLSLTPIRPSSTNSEPHHSTARLASPLQATPSSGIQTDKLRERGLALSEEITTFLNDRRSHEVGPEPGVTITQPNGDMRMDNQTPPYMRDTRELFVEKFESRVADLHDELSSRGLQDTMLNDMYNSIPTTTGNIDAAIGDIAGSLRRLSLLIPPEGLYKDETDLEVAKIALEESNLMDKKANDAMRKIEAQQGPALDAAHRLLYVRFYFDFSNCCLNQVEYLRAELLRRLGPSAYDADEMESFVGPFGLASVNGSSPESAIEAVREYRRSPWPLQWRWDSPKCR